MARAWGGRGEYRALLVRECDHFAERFRDRGLHLTELRNELVNGEAVTVNARFVFSALYHADHPGWQQFTYQRVKDATFTLTESDELVSA